jgi:hypothetical protein
MSEVKFGSYEVKVSEQNGEFDQDAALAAFASWLSGKIDLYTKDQEVILGAIQNVYAPNPELVLNRGALKTIVLNQIGFTPATYNALSERIEEVINSNDRFYSTQGKGGGLRQMSDAEHAHFQATGQTPADVARAAKKAEKASK